MTTVNASTTDTTASFTQSKTPISPDKAQRRLRAAARILASGAIRAALAEKAVGKLTNEPASPSFDDTAEHA